MLNENTNVALQDKWSPILEGIEDSHVRESTAALLENQARAIMTETSKEQIDESTTVGSLGMFQKFAFPIVRRVFAGLIANELVSVQPMSLPSGLIFFLDFTVSDNGAGLPRLGYGGDGNPAVEGSLYGGNVVGAQLTGGVDLATTNAEKGPYNLNNGYSSPTGSGQLGVITFISSSVYSSSAGDIAKLC